MIAEQGEQITGLREQVEESRATVARLERAISRNSGNSSMPPSTDDLPGRKPPSRQQRRAAQRGARKRGKQPGAPGAGMCWAQPDKVIDHHPRGNCACGADLADAEDLGVASSCQQLDIPAPAATRIQHDLHAAQCACGREHVAARPPGVPDAPVSIGPGLRTLAVYLLVFQHMPVGRCRQLIEDATGAQVSDGFIHPCLATAAAAITDVIKLIKTLITAAQVAGFDGTTGRAGPAGQKRYVLGAFTERYSLLFPGERTLESFRQFGILPHFGGVAVPDRYVTYFHDGWQHLASHQACCSHLIRDFEDAAQAYPGAIWPVQAQRALRGLIKARHRACGQDLDEIPEQVREPMVSEFRHAVLAGLSDVPRIPGPRHSTAQHPGRDLLEFCHHHRDDVLRFCHDTKLWPTNNISERGIRPLKTQQKTSGRLTSADVTQHRLDIRSYIDTARKHGHDAFAVLRSAMTGNPWRPPFPAAASP